MLSLDSWCDLKLPITRIGIRTFNAPVCRLETQPLKLCHFVAIWISKYIAVPKKNEGNPNARGAIERIEIDRKQNINPETMNNADII